MKRRIKSFEADADVEEMLDRARLDRMKLGKVCNEAVRRFLHEKGYSSEKGLAESRALDRKSSARCTGGDSAARCPYLSNCCEPEQPKGWTPSRSEQNPQVPLASEDASLRQVPGNAETAVGPNFVRSRKPATSTLKPMKNCNSTLFNNLKNGHSDYRFDITNSRTLLIAVVEQAVLDFKELAAAERIVSGKVAPGNGRRVREYRTDAEVQALIDFFNSRVMDEWIHLAGIRINPNQIRLKLGLRIQEYGIYQG